MADIQKYINSGAINIGTIYKVSPIKPFRTIYFHVGMITKIENGVEIFHLNKGFFVKSAEKIFIPFSDNKNNIFHFHRGVNFLISEPLDQDDLIEMSCRMEEVLSKPHIPYGLRLPQTFNCDNLIIYVKKGEKTISPQVLNFENKYIHIGPIVVFIFDMFIKITNKIGFIKYFNKN